MTNEADDNCVQDMEVKCDENKCIPMANVCDGTNQTQSLSLQTQLVFFHEFPNLNL